MPTEAIAQSCSIHSTAVAIAGEALLILGASGAGKSRLAFDLIRASTHRRPIVLIGDDRIILSDRGGGLAARGHPRIQGFIERRGSGILACPFVAAAPVRGVVELGPTSTPIPALQNFPCLRFVTSDASDAAAVLAWWRDPSTTQRAKAPTAARSSAKD